MAFEIRILGEPDAGGEGRSVEVRLKAWPRADEDPEEDSHFFAAGDGDGILRAVASLLRRGTAALPVPHAATCRRCDQVGDPAGEGERRSPFVCRACQVAAAAKAADFDDFTDGAGGPGVEVLFLGTGNAFGAGGRRQSAIFLRARGAGKGILLDAGPGCHTALRGAGLDGEDIAAVVVSHFHGDHFGGLPFLELDGLRTRRRARLSILAPPGAGERLADLRECLYPGFGPGFPEEIHELLPGESAPLPNGTGGGRATPFAAAHQPNRWAFCWKVRIGRRTVVYSGDTALTRRMLRESAGADLLIHECSGVTPLPGHTSHAELTDARGRIRARRVLLAHTGTEVQKLRDPLFEVAHDGMRLIV